MTDGIYATGFDTVYTATIYIDDVAGAIVTYSVNSYVYAMQNSEKATMQALAKATYNYGVSAVKFKNDSDDIIMFQKPHPGNIIKSYVINKIIEKLERKILKN